MQNIASLKVARIFLFFENTYLTLSFDSNYVLILLNYWKFTKNGAQVRIDLEA